MNNKNFNLEEFISFFEAQQNKPLLYLIYLLSFFFSFVFTCTECCLFIQ